MNGPKMRAKEAAEYLRVSIALLAKLRSAGGGPNYAKPSARLVLYDRRDLDAWLSARMLNRTGGQFTPVGNEA